MAGFEVVVRPVVFPDIRPRARQSLPPQDDPDKGFAVIRGQPAQTVSMSSSHNVGSSHSKPVEFGRRIDKVRVYEPKEPADPGGPQYIQSDFLPSSDPYVDIEVANQIETGIDVPGPVQGYDPGSGGFSPGAGGGGGERTVTYYRSIDRQELAPNIQVQQRNVIQRNDK